LGGRALSSIDFQSSINLPKMEASKLDAAVLHAMRACGFSGYSNDTEYRPPPP
jgi:acyl-CoA dehydrogenase